MKRRSFLTRLLGGAAAIVVTPKVIIPEPIEELPKDIESELIDLDPVIRGDQGYVPDYLPDLSGNGNHLKGMFTYQFGGEVEIFNKKNELVLKANKFTVREEGDIYREPVAMYIDITTHDLFKQPAEGEVMKMRFPKFPALLLADVVLQGSHITTSASRNNYFKADLVFKVVSNLEIIEV